MSTPIVGRKPGIAGDFQNVRDAVGALATELRGGRSLRWILSLIAAWLVLDAWLGMSIGRFALASALAALVPVVEILNTIVEMMCDKYWPRTAGPDPDIARIKHAAALMVLLAAVIITPAEVWLTLYPR